MTTYSREAIVQWLDQLANGTVFTDTWNQGLALAAKKLIESEADDDLLGSVEQLSPHFTLSELIHSETAKERNIDNSPGDEEIENLVKLAGVLEKIRTICNGKPVLISSGFRCVALNAAVGGASNSAHLYGCAADISIPQFGSPLEVCDALYPHIDELGIDQLIFETKSVGRSMGARRTSPLWRSTFQSFSIVNGSTGKHPFPG
jgi:zinc D-Ala-D-Ala carboxypeptidase